MKYTSTLCAALLRSLLVALAVMLFFSDGRAQQAKMTLAEKSYNLFDYYTAADIYRDILAEPKWANDTAALRRLAECERRTGQLVPAEQHLRKLAAMPNPRLSDLLSLADLLKHKGLYNDALNIYMSILELFPGNSIAAAYVKNPAYAQEMMRDSSIYTLTNARINSPGSDFGAGFFERSRILFASSRGNGAGGNREYAWNRQPYLNLYSANILADSTLDKVALLHGDVNSRFHEGTCTYDWSSKTLYITRNNYIGAQRNDSKNGILNLGIFSTKYSGDENWGPLVPFTHNNPEHSVAHPTFSQDYSMMLFTSDMPGGAGGNDIWYCAKKEGAWDKPVNLTQINTPGDEMFPFFAADSILYFSSNGHPGLGGLDNFMIRLADPQPEVLNLGYPVNSRYDDFGIICFDNQAAGYFSSNRPQGKGDDDIWEFKLHPPDSVIITGKAIEMLSNTGIGKAMIKVEDDKGIIATVYSGPDGSYRVAVPWTGKITVTGDKKDYIPGTLSLEPDPRKTTIENADVILRKLDYAAKGRVIFSDNNAPATGAMVRLLSDKRQPLDTIIVGREGTYIFALNKNQRYIIEASLAGYITLSTEVNTDKLPDKLHQYEFKLFKPEKGVVVRLDNIYYDYNKDAIRPDAAVELDKLVKILQDNPTMKIELGSHTDARGSDSYNLSLSERRAKSAVNYMISKGIASSRLVPKGYGETKLLNHCSDGVECFDEEHQFNRRTEFLILDI